MSSPTSSSASTLPSSFSSSSTSSSSLFFSGRVCVIGAGVSGLVAMKECVDAGLTPVCFERQADVGGVWVYDDKLKQGQGSAIYQSLITNSSKEFTCFSDFPFDPSDPPYLPHDQLLRYYRRYADHHHLRDFVQFRTSVVKVEQVLKQDVVDEHVLKAGATNAEASSNTRWRVITKKLKDDGEEEEEEEEYFFDFVMLCSGVYSKPHTPDYPGLSSFTGRVLHSNEFRCGGDFRDCGNVLVVGASNSAGDVAAEISHNAKQVWLSMRDGTWVIGRQGPGGSPIDMTVQTRFLQCFVPEWLRAKVAAFIANSKLDHNKLGLESSRKIFCGAVMINDEIGMRILSGKVKAKSNIARFTAKGVEFEDGTKVDNIDAVVFATGYIPYWSYMDQSLVQEGAQNMHLYEFIFPPRLGSHPTLAVIGGVSCLGAHGPVFELQSRWAAQVFTGKSSLPSPDVMSLDIRRQMAEMRERFGRPKIHFPSVPYMETLAEKVGCKPEVRRLALTDPKLAFRLLFGPCIPPTYRLQGPHSWDGARDAVLSCKKNTEMPTMTRSVKLEKNIKNSKAIEQCNLQKEINGFDYLVPKFLSDLRVGISSSLLSFVGVFLCVFYGRYLELI